jgi:hypothetical protein
MLFLTEYVVNVRGRKKQADSGACLFFSIGHDDSTTAIMVAHFAYQAHALAHIHKPMGACPRRGQRGLVVLLLMVVEGLCWLAFVSLDQQPSDLPTQHSHSYDHHHTRTSITYRRAACSTSTHDLAPTMEEDERRLAFGCLFGGRLCFLGQGTSVGVRPSSPPNPIPLPLPVPLGLSIRQYCFTRHLTTPFFLFRASLSSLPLALSSSHTLPPNPPFSPNSLFRVEWKPRITVSKVRVSENLTSRRSTSK